MIPTFLQSHFPVIPVNLNYLDFSDSSITVSLYSYLERIQKANVDGVYLDIIDAFDYFEEKVSN